jgi:hypothetical protein
VRSLYNADIEREVRTWSERELFGLVGLEFGWLRSVVNLPGPECGFVKTKKVPLFATMSLIEPWGSWKICLPGFLGLVRL